MKLSVVIPVFNEVKTIKEIIGKVQAVDIDKEIIIVDDGSTDGTKKVLQELKSDNIKVFFHEKNSGKGRALKTGFKQAKGDVVIVQDADLEYDPYEYKALLDPIIKHDADVVYGSRLSGGRTVRAYMFWHKVGNAVVTFFTNFLYNTTITDMETGYKVFKREVVDNLDIRSRDFTVEAEITAKVFKKRYIVYEVPISYYGRSYAEGKKIRWYHAVSAIWALIKYKFMD